MSKQRENKGGSGREGEEQRLRWEGAREEDQPPEKKEICEADKRGVCSRPTVRSVEVVVAIDSQCQCDIREYENERM